jgi:hypothetical protein
MKKSITQADRIRPSRRASAAPAAAMGYGTLGYLWSRTDMLKEVLNVVQGVSAWPGVTIAHDGGGLRVCLRGVTLGHVRWNGRIDLPFESDVRERLVEEEMAYADRARADGRIFFKVRNQLDVDRALWLFRLAYLTADSTSGACT